MKTTVARNPRKKRVPAGYTVSCFLWRSRVHSSSDGVHERPPAVKPPETLCCINDGTVRPFTAVYGVLKRCKMPPDGLAYLEVRLLPRIPLCRCPVTTVLYRSWTCCSCNCLVPERPSSRGDVHRRKRKDRLIRAHGSGRPGLRLGQRLGILQIPRGIANETGQFRYIGEDFCMVQRAGPWVSYEVLSFFFMKHLGCLPLEDVTLKPTLSHMSTLLFARSDFDDWEGHDAASVSLRPLFRV